AEFSKSLGAVIGMFVSRDGVLWMLDMGSPDTSAKLVGWSTTTDTLHAVHYLPKQASVANSFHQDFAIDEVRGRAFIADMSRGDMVGASTPAIVVVDLNTGHARRVLESAAALQPKEDPVANVEGNPMTFTGPDGVTTPLRLGLNPIGIDQASEFVYFSTITPGPMYRIDAALLGDFEATEEQLAAAIEEVGPKPTSDGIAVDGETVYITNLEDHAITALRGGELHHLAADAARAAAGRAAEDGVELEADRLDRPRADAVQLREAAVMGGALEVGERGHVQLVDEASREAGAHAGQRGEQGRRVVGAEEAVAEPDAARLDVLPEVVREAHADPREVGEGVAAALAVEARHRLLEVPNHGGRLEVGLDAVRVALAAADEHVGHLLEGLSEFDVGRSGGGHGVLGQCGPRCEAAVTCVGHGHEPP
ncbi:MAG: L-dopachrome tautomerase-related protein, partial [Bacteroidota bacterium]